MNTLPKAKLDNVVVQDLKGELLVYNLTTNLAFCLNETAAKVFELCDGETSFAELKNKQNLTDEIIYLALDKLKDLNLLEGDYISPFAGLNRREVIRKVGLASMIALPVIASITVPQASHAASLRGLNETCTKAGPFSTECKSSICTSSTNANGNGRTLRCCNNNAPIAGTTGYMFAGTNQTDCSYRASAEGNCCSNEAIYSNGTCICT